MTPTFVLINGKRYRVVKTYEHRDSDISRFGGGSINVIAYDKEVMSETTDQDKGKENHHS